MFRYLACSAIALTIVCNLAKSEEVPGPAFDEVQASSPWVDESEHDGIVYFAYSFPFEIKRYSLPEKQWLSSIYLPHSPQAIVADQSELLIAFSTWIGRFDLEGNQIDVVYEDDNLGSVNKLTRRDDLLFIERALSVISFNLENESVIDELTGSFRPGRLTLPAGQSVLFGRSVAIYPARMVKVPFDESGLFQTQQSWPYHGAMPLGSRVFVSDDGQRASSSSGIVLDGETLSVIGGAGGPFNDMLFLGEDLFVLDDSSLRRLDSGLGEVGVRSLNDTYISLHSWDGSFFLFGERDGEPVTKELRSNSIAPRVYPTPSNPVDTPYLTRHVDIDNHGNVLLLEEGGHTAHRFSTTEWGYIDSIGLPESLNYIALVRTSGDLYFSLDGGGLGHVDALTGQRGIVGHNPVSPHGLAAAGEFMFVTDSTGAWHSHRTYSSTGQLLDWKDWNRYSREYVWNEANGRIYFFRDSASPNNIMWERISNTGEILESQGSPLHGGVQAVLPIRVRPDGSFVILGSGQVFEGISLNLLGSMGFQPADVAWVGNVMYTLREGENGSTVERWTEAFVIDGAASIFGDAVRLLSGPAGLVAVTEHDGHTFLIRVPADLEGFNLSSRVYSETPSVLPGQTAVARAVFVNEGPQGTVLSDMSVVVDVPLDAMEWTCASASGAIPCSGEQELHLSRELAPGDWVEVEFSATIPQGFGPAAHLTAGIASAVPDLYPDDDVQTVTIKLEQTVFHDQFESQ